MNIQDILNHPVVTYILGYLTALIIFYQSGCGV